MNFLLLAFWNHLALSSAAVLSYSKLFASAIAKFREGKKAGGGEKIPITGDAKAGDKDDSENSKARN
ncbi:hypothetical protein MFRU_005g02060 [Monilinia fructicola]|nr:hypothetical protein MFRU_005g02060 [Monilinia fructicola]